MKYTIMDTGIVGTPISPVDMAPAMAGSDRFIAMTDQIRYCVSPTRPIPRIFPSISSVGRTDAMITSTIRLVFSSMTPRRF